MTGDDPGVVFSKGRDPDEIVTRLPDVLERALDGVSDARVGPIDLPVGAGRSNETVLFDATWVRDGRTETGSWVLRIAPEVFQLFLDPDIRMQYDLMRALHERGSVKVPRMLLFEEDRSIFGQPFFVMERVRGRVPVTSPVYNASGWLHDASPAERRIVWETAVEELTRIHTVPLDAVPCVPTPPPGQDGLDAELAYWRRSMSFSAMGAVPDVFHVMADWLDAERPGTHVDGLSWGDARMGNMMFGDDFRLLAVLDWEQATRAGALRDLGWWLFFDHQHSVGKGVARLDGLGTRQETIDLWEERVGRSTADVRWYEAFAGYCVAQLWLRNQLLLGLDHEAAMATNPFVGRTLELMGERMSERTSAVR